MPFVKYKSTPNQKLEVRWERQHTLPALHYGCIMPIPSLQLQKKPVCIQRSRGFGHGVVVSRTCWGIFRSPMCSMWPLQNNEWFWRLSFYPRWVVGLPAFQLPMFAKCDCRWKEESCFTCLFRLRNLNLHSLPVAWCSWEPESWFSTVYHHLCIMETALQQKSCCLHYCHHVSHFCPSHPVNRR